MFFFNSIYFSSFYNNNNIVFFFSFFHNIIFNNLILKEDLHLSFRLHTWRLTITCPITNLHDMVQVTTLTSDWNVGLQYLSTWSLHFFQKNWLFKIGACNLILRLLCIFKNKIKNKFVSKYNMMLFPL